MLAGCGSSSDSNGGGGTPLPDPATLRVRDAENVNDMSADGRLAGAARGRAAYWARYDQVPVALRTLPGHQTTEAWCVDEDGRTVGYATDPEGDLVAFYWADSGAVPTLLPVPNGYAFNAEDPQALKLVHGGGIIGSLQNVQSGEAVLAYWSKPDARPVLTATADGRPEEPISVSDNGLLVARTELDEPRNLWQLDATSRKFRRLDLARTSGTPLALPNAVSHKGRIAGTIGAFPTAVRPAWFANTNAAGTTLPALAGYRVFPEAITDTGLLGGYGLRGEDLVAVTWRNGQITNLNSRLPRGSEYQLDAVVDITDNGQALVFGTAPDGEPVWLIVRVP